jgi:hypothetical protein
VNETILRTLAIGVGATLLMDAWGALLRRFGIPGLNFAYLGRWIGHLPQLAHASIAKSPPVRGERLLGWCAHYTIGITFAALLVATSGLTPTLVSALAIGLVTVIAPLFILQPALGLGIASSKTPRPLFNSLKSVATHTVFGLGLYLAARAIS